MQTYHQRQGKGYIPKLDRSAWRAGFERYTSKGGELLALLLRTSFKAAIRFGVRCVITKAVNVLMLITPVSAFTAAEKRQLAGRKAPTSCGCYKSQAEIDAP